MFQENYTLQYWKYKKEYEEEEGAEKEKSGRRVEFLEEIQLERSDRLADMILRDPNDKKESSKKSYVSSKVKPRNKNEYRDIVLRPNKNEVLKKDISRVFIDFNQEKEKSHKSVKSSERLSKKDRNRVRNEIFKDKDLLPSKEEFEEMKIVEEENENRLS